MVALKRLAAVVLASASACEAIEFSQWMGDLEPVLGPANSTLLDVSLPGAHDALTCAGPRGDGPSTHCERDPTRPTPQI